MNDWLQQFPLLATIDPVEKAELVSHVGFVDLPAGKSVYHVGDHCKHYLLVLSGSVRVQMYSHNGHEIVLYRVGDGESCILTTSCLLANEVYQAEAITETPVHAAMIPADSFDHAMATSAGFRHFVFSGYARRVADLLYLINTIAFERMDVRLANFLVQHMGQQRILHMTHQDIANELGTAREVVSRLLKELEKRGVIYLQRGSLTIENPEALKKLGDN